MRALGLRLVLLLILGSIGEAVIEAADGRPIHEPASLILWLGMGVVIALRGPEPA